MLQTPVQVTLGNYVGKRGTGENVLKIYRKTPYSQKYIWDPIHCYLRGKKMATVTEATRAWRGLSGETWWSRGEVALEYQDRCDLVEKRLNKDAQGLHRWEGGGGGGERGSYRKAFPL